MEFRRGCTRAEAGDCTGHAEDNSRMRGSSLTAGVQISPDILKIGERRLMRILHIIGTLDPAAGGPTESVRVLLSYGPIGYTGEVVTLDDPSAPYLNDIG